MNQEFFDALAMMEKERGIPAEFIAEKISTAIVTALKKDYDGNEVVFCDIDCAQKVFRVYLRKTAVEEVENEFTEIALEDAKKYNKKAVAGDEIEIELNTKDFGRIAAQTAKHVIRQGIRDVEHSQALQAFQSKHQELVTATIQRIDPRTGNATISIGHSEAVLPHSEQVPGEVLREGEMIKVYIVDVRETEKGPRVMISRTHPGMVKRLLEMEVPEIYDGTVEVKAVSREAGSRTKLAVASTNDDVDAVGACIGPKGTRINKIVEELGGEKLDVVRYSEDPVAFISEALSPAKVVSVEIDPEGAKNCRVVVPDNQLSLAIGNKGQNARLAARLTGWKIDIRPESAAQE